MPSAIFTILNPEPAILDGFVKSEKTSLIETRIASGDNVAIEKMGGIVQSLNEHFGVDLDTVVIHAEAYLVTNAIAFLLMLGLRSRRWIIRKKMRRCHKQ